MLTVSQGKNGSGPTVGTFASSGSLLFQGLAIYKLMMRTIGHKKGNSIIRVANGECLYSSIEYDLVTVLLTFIIMYFIHHFINIMYFIPGCIGD